MGAGVLGLAGHLMGRWATSPAVEVALTRFYQFMGTGPLLLPVGTLMLGWNYADTAGGAWSCDLTELTGVKVAPASASIVFFLLFYGLTVRAGPATTARMHAYRT